MNFGPADNFDEQFRVQGLDRGHLVVAGLLEWQKELLK